MTGGRVKDRGTLEGRRALRQLRAPEPIAIAIATGLFAFGVYLWQLSVPRMLSGYDSGVYLAAAIHLVSGVPPYRDFLFVQPPGILLLLSPVAWFSRVFGSHDGLVLARGFTSLVTALNVALLTWLVRHRGRTAMVIAGVGLALLPIAFFVSSAVKLEPFCICFVLLGALIVLSHDHDGHEVRRRSLLMGGLFFGLAALVKLWAFFPFLAMVICLVPRQRSRVLPFVAGAAGGFIVPCLPFLALAPGNFFSQVFAAQLLQRATPVTDLNRLGVAWRLADLTGFPNTTGAPTGNVVVLVFGLLAVLVALVSRRRQWHEIVDAFLLLSAVITVGALLATPEFGIYYAYFAAPFLVGVFAVAVARLGEPTRRLLRRIKISGATRGIVLRAGAIAGALLVAVLTLVVTGFYTNYASVYGLGGSSLAPLDKEIPAGSCVVYDIVFYGVSSNRLQSDNPRCPAVVDLYGMWLSWGSHGNSPPRQFVAEWRSYFEAAQYAVFTTPHTYMIPWNASLTSWFDTHYHLVSHSDYVYIYANDSNGPSVH